MTSPETLEEIEFGFPALNPGAGPIPSSVSRDFRTSYMDPALFDARNTVERAVSELTLIREQVEDFDSLVCTGMSGALLVGWVAAELGVPFAVVRKPDDNCHHGEGVMGTVGERWLFFDDFVSSGATVVRVLSTMAGLKQGWPSYADVPNECVGVYAWKYDYQSLDRLAARHTRLQDYLRSREIGS